MYQKCASLAEANQFRAFISKQDRLATDAGMGQGAAAGAAGKQTSRTAARKWIRSVSPSSRSEESHQAAALAHNQLVEGCKTPEEFVGKVVYGAIPGMFRQWVDKSPPHDALQTVWAEFVRARRAMSDASIAWWMKDAAQEAFFTGDALLLFNPGCARSRLMLDLPGLFLDCVFVGGIGRV